MEVAFKHQVTGTPVNIKSARETFYKELIQNTNLPTNHNFASIITEINKEIEHHTQQRYLITYTSKSKEKLQTPAVTPRKIQPPTWKKNRIESPSNPSYHYIPGSTINISLTDVQNNPNSELINQQNLSLAIVINQLPINPIAELIQQSLQLPPQQPVQQQLLQQPPQPPNLDPMAYAPIAKLDNFTGKENDT
ncbi:hypothetical protein G9A89_013490 [Geosiphon pyriformis]|nr:hypothetical protein G9A89_013490 [Geosiphon pyriformis]